MQEAYFWSVVSLVWIFGWVTVWLVRKRALEAKTMKLREMLHQERLAAIKEGVPLPEIPDPEEPLSAWLTLEAEQVRAAWLRRVSLIFDLALPDRLQPSHRSRTSRNAAPAPHPRRGDARRP